MKDAFFHAVAFLTRLPVPRHLDNDAWAKSPPFYPVVGLVMGILLATLAWLLQFLAPPTVSAVLLVTFWVFLTGGLHLDGLMDTADGFGSNRSKERILEIMKDSRVGAMGVIAAILVLGNKVATLASLQGHTQTLALLLAPLLGRTAMLIALFYLPYAREEGLATNLRAVGKWGKRLSFAFVALCVLISAVWLKTTVFLVILIPLLVGWRLISPAIKKIGGCTGDMYGALCELTEATVLLALSIGSHFGGLA